jgi:hypothetical protein
VDLTHQEASEQAAGPTTWHGRAVALGVPVVDMVAIVIRTGPGGQLDHMRAQPARCPGWAGPVRKVLRGGRSGLREHLQVRLERRDRGKCARHQRGPEKGQAARCSDRHSGSTMPG